MARRDAAHVVAALFFRGWDTLRSLGSMWAQRNQTREKSDDVKLVMHEGREEKISEAGQPDLVLPLTLEFTPANSILFHFLKNRTEYVPLI